MLKREINFAFTNYFFMFYFALLSFVQNFLSCLLGGEKCLCCSKRTLRIPLCRKCLLELSNFKFIKTCSRCGRQLISEIGLCSVCRENSALQSLDGVCSLYDYQLWKKSLLFAWKMENKRNLSVYFAWLFYRKLRSLEDELGFSLPVVPVPPRAGKIRERGWDQIDDLCYYLSKGWGVRILPLLERVSRTQQKKLDRNQRVESIGTSYRLRKEKALRRIIPKVPDCLVLADDVLTTGSTLESCARELKALGVKKVFSITLFIVD